MLAQTDSVHDSLHSVTDYYVDVNDAEILVDDFGGVVCLVADELVPVDCAGKLHSLENRSDCSHD